jgi:hypothetical protein
LNEEKKIDIQVDELLKFFALKTNII